MVWDDSADNGVPDTRWSLEQDKSGLLDINKGTDNVLD